MTTTHKTVEQLDALLDRLTREALAAHPDDRDAGRAAGHAAFKAATAGPEWKDAVLRKVFNLVSDEVYLGLSDEELAEAHPEVRERVEYLRHSDEPEARDARHRAATNAIDEAGLTPLGREVEKLIDGTETHSLATVGFMKAIEAGVPEAVTKWQQLCDGTVENRRTALMLMLYSGVVEKTDRPDGSADLFYPMPNHRALTIFRRVAT